MTLTIEIPEAETIALKERAQAEGLSAEQYALRVLEREIAPDWLRRSWQSARQTGTCSLSMDEIDAEIAAARKARKRARTFPGS